LRFVQSYAEHDNQDFFVRERGMKRILFVDDEPQVLGELQRALEPQKAQWEMVFARTGQEALALLGAKPFDAIVSDVSMPEMDGATLLKAVCEKFPGVVRIVLASQPEMASALRTISVAHQFLLKPCDPHVLRVGVERATSLSQLLSNKMLEGIVGSVKDLPALSATYLALREKLAEPEASVKDVVGLVEQDVGISAKILQLVNSAFFGLPREISTLRTAVSFLGMNIVQNLVLSTEVFRVFNMSGTFSGFSFEELHVHSQLTAKIAARLESPGAIPGVAVVAGLLHDVGKLVLATRAASYFSRALTGAREENRPQYEVEEQLMGVSHAEVGAYLLGLWGLPSHVVEAVAYHHQPQRVPHDTFDAVDAVHVANYLAHAHPVGPPMGDPVAYRPLDLEYLKGLGVADQLPEWEAMAADAASEMSGGSVERKESKVVR
jgi:putative nucleotidyltransferase with HDIG domain